MQKTHHSTPIQTEPMRHTLPLRYIDAVVNAGSIRKAAHLLAITSTALNRRILAMEDELGVELFERLPRGVRLTAAGELFLHHVRTQLADLDRVKGQIADLKGIRRGHINMACSQALLSSFLPRQIAQYRGEHPNVTFGVHLRDRAQAEQALADMSADLALVFEPVQFADFQVLYSARQPIHAIMAATHPLAQKETVRLSDCLQYPLALPTKAYGVRYLLEQAMLNTSLKLEPVIESDSFAFLRYQALTEQVITFQIAIGSPVDSDRVGLVTRAMDTAEVPAGMLYLGQLRGRSLPVPAAKFANQLMTAFEALYG